MGDDFVVSMFHVKVSSLRWRSTRLPISLKIEGHFDQRDLSDPQTDFPLDRFRTVLQMKIRPAKR